MWQKQMRQVHTLCKAARGTARPSRAKQQIEEAQKKQEMLSRIIQKELDHTTRLVWLLTFILDIFVFLRETEAMGRVFANPETQKKGIPKRFRKLFVYMIH